MPPTVRTRTVAKAPQASEREVDELEQQTAQLRMLVGQIARRLRTRSSAGLSPSEISVLLAVARASAVAGAVSVSGVAEREGMNPSMVSRIAAGLSEAGLLEREPDPLDKRIVFLRPTAAGRRLRERIHRERSAALAPHVRDLSEQEREALWRALPVLEHLVERLDGGGR